MIQIGPEDTTELSTFALKWRWLDERYASLSEEDRSRIHPLRPEKAEELWRLSLESISKVHDFAVDSRVFEGVERVSTAGDVRPWLAARLPAGRVPLLVSWTRDLAVLTDAELFTTRWDDFCYPASDDVSVFPFDGAWVLRYWHEEEFLYARKRKTKSEGK